MFWSFTEYLKSAAMCTSMWCHVTSHPKPQCCSGCEKLCVSWSSHPPTHPHTQTLYSTQALPASALRQQAFKGYHCTTQWDRHCSLWSSCKWPCPHFHPNHNSQVDDCDCWKCHWQKHRKARQEKKLQHTVPFKWRVWKGEDLEFHEDVFFLSPILRHNIDIYLFIYDQLVKSVVFTYLHCYSKSQSVKVLFPRHSPAQN